jgi:hypothetical protein
MEQWYEILIVILSSMVKFAVAPFIAKAFGFTYLETIAFCSFGGILGFIVFYFLGIRIVNLLPIFFKPLNKSRKVFNRRNKMFVNLIRTYGLFGLAIFSPILITIPVGAFLAARYYGTHKIMVLIVMSMAVILWAATISTYLFLFFDAY